jgi:NADP-dependent 3-hydroxy acid dehydrogenase YdfG
MLSGLGLRLGLVSRNAAELESLAGELGGRGLPVPADVRSPGDLGAAIGTVREKLGPVRVLVNAAGTYHYGPLIESAEADYDRVVDTNLKGLVSCCRLVLGDMIAEGGGDIVNIASIAGKVGTPGRSLYCASKFGVVGFSQALAEEVREHGIRVTVLCPGSTNTRFSLRELEGKAVDRMLQPTDVAHAVRMVLTQAPASFMSEIILRPTRKP